MDNLVINIKDNKNLVTNTLHNFALYLEKKKNFKYLNLEKNISPKINLEKHLKDNSIKNIIFFCESILFFDLNYLRELYSKYNIICYHADVEEKFEQYYVYISQIADVILVAEKSELLRYLPYNFNVIHFAISFDISKKIEEYKKDRDLIFIGNMNRPGRRELLDSLKQANINLEVYGIGTKNGPISEDKMNYLYQRSKITINLTGTSLVKAFFKKDIKVKNLLKQGKGRYLEAMLYNCLVISQSSYDLDEIFKKNLMVEANSFEEFEKSIKYYLNNENKLSKIVNNAKKFVELNYSHENNYNKLSQEINKIVKKKNKNFYSDNILFSYIFRFLLYEFIKNIFTNFKWSIYCLKRIFFNFKFINIFDIPLFFKYIFFK